MKTIEVNTRVNGKVEKVWEYWTTPEHITNWNFASDKWRCPNAINDLKPDGKFSRRMVRITFIEKDGFTEVSETFDPDENDPELQRQGWQAILDNFKQYVEAN
jgi:uncharacterized protein YndB with AHSA1/START domain